MRLVTLVTILLTAMVTQSCKITMPSLTELLLSNYLLHGRFHPDAYDPYNFRKSKALSMQTGFKDTIIIGDDIDRHGKNMHRIIAGIPVGHSEYIFTSKEEGTGVSKKNIVFFSQFRRGTRNEGNPGLELLLSDAWTDLREATRVVHLPLFVPLRRPKDAPRIQTTNILFVVAADNVQESYKGNRDLYNSNHVVWSDPNLGTLYRGRAQYENVIEVYKTGKAIAATSAQVNEDETVSPYERVVQCGDIKESCFTIVPAQATSNASARLAAMSFYLSQFWETPEEVVEVLKQCSLDVGEPGVDREFGQGVANLLCPAVLKKELEVVSGYHEDVEASFEADGGALEGVWEAEDTVLEVHIPGALKETLQIEYRGTVNGVVEFAESTMRADFIANASVAVSFLLDLPIEAGAEETVQTREKYIAMKDTLSTPGLTYSYSATEDSLHLIRSYTLNEALALLPDPFGSMVDVTSGDFFVNNPIQIRMSFAKVSPALVGDFDGNGIVDTADFLIFVQAFGSVRGDRVYDESLDIVPDGMINIADFLLFIDQFGKTRDS